MKKLLSALAAASVTTALSSASALASDPCAGYDVACDADGCLVCWADPTGDVDLICEEMSLIEVSMTLPGCVGDDQEFGLVVPQGPRGPQLIDVGGQAELPQTPRPQQRDPNTPVQ